MPGTKNAVMAIPAIINQEPFLSVFRLMKRLLFYRAGRKQ